MDSFIPPDAEFAFDHLVGLDDSAHRRPDGLLDRTLLAFPDSFGASLAKPLAQARELVLREGDARSREILLAGVPEAAARQEIARVRRLLVHRPTAVERASPALVRISERMVIALAHPVPAGGRRLSVRIQADLHPEAVHASASRIEPDAELLARWSALGHAGPPHSAWVCEPPSWLVGSSILALAIELVPNPSSFNEAMLVAHAGSGRVLAVHDARDPCIDIEPWRPASVLPSGWSYLRGDRAMGSSLPYLPNGAPRPTTHVRVPQDDLFALCAAQTWAASLRDSIWLRRRHDLRLLRGGTTTDQGENP